MVYILGNGSRWQDNEIRFSLRSLQKYVPHNRVFVVGERPAWLQNIEHIPAIDGFEKHTAARKLKNAIHKIRTACLHPDVGEKFVLMNDDFFFLRNVSCIETVHLGPINEAIREHSTKDGYYYAAMIETRDLLNASGFEVPMNYEAHYPMVIEKRKFLKMSESITWHDTGYLFRSIYGNVFGIGGKKRPADTKLYFASDLKLLASGDFISTSDRVALSPQFQKFIKERFPEPSRYEDPETTPEALSEI